MGPRPSSEWIRILEDNGNTRGEAVQREYPRIRPARGGMKENDIYGHLDTFTIHCGSSRHYAIVHNDVVLGQSPQLRALYESARRDHPGEPVRLSSRVRWWQVAWALEYMYQGSVPSFGFLACEEMPDGDPERPSRSIAWGLLQLWDVGHFFGLRELKLRAEEAFKAYFRKTIRHSILSHRGAVVGRYRPELRLIQEFYLATWRIFDYSPWFIEYIGVFSGLVDRSSISSPAGQDVYRAIQAWESTVFDREGAPVDPGLYYLPRAAIPSCVAFRPVMRDLCMELARSGLLELAWFQNAMFMDTAMGLRVALAERMWDPESVWPRDEYPGAPYSFVRVNPWRLIASNAREVPSQSAQHEGTPMQEQE